MLADEFRAHHAFLRGVCERLGRPQVLDVGCGTGRHLLHLAPWIAGGVGIDFALRMIERANANAVAARAGRVRFTVAEAVAVDRKSLGQFDLVLFIGTLEHVRQPAKALAAARSVLAKAGRIVVIMPHRASLFFALRHWRQGAGGRFFSSDSLYDVAQLRRLAGASGLLVDAVHPLPFSVNRPGEPPVPLFWRAVAAILMQIPTPATRGAFAVVLRERREDPRARPSAGTRPGQGPGDAARPRP